ncbi:hypothetical protein JCM8097_001531 [Rhodosporidiobolus ruineniae]
MPHLLRRLSRTSTASSSGPPPPYTSTASTPSPPSSSTVPPPAAAPAPPVVFPEEYRVHPRLPTVCFVRPDQLLSHLKLLGAFHALEARVKAAPPGGAEIELVEQGGKALDGKKRWALFVTMAVGRFERWLQKLEGNKLGASMLPPLDVALVLHSYQLNPRRLDEDRLRIFPQLKELQDLLLQRLAETISPNSAQYYPPPDDVQDWEELIKEPFDGLTAYEESKGRFVNSPRDGIKTFVPWLTPDGTGYAQSSFRYLSPSGDLITHERLGLAKLSSDIYDVTAGSYRFVPGYSFGPAFGLAMAETVDTGKFLAGTVVSSLEAPATPSESYRAKYVRDRLQDRSTGIGRLSTRQEAAGRMGWTREGARRVLVQHIGETRKRCVTHILTCYTGGEPFSLDLAAAVLRQGSFIRKMSSLGWLDSGRFAAENDQTMQRCVARYHAFMSLLQSMPHVFCVPTLDIDLAWHTHQLSLSYRSHTWYWCGRFVDHDDKVEENALSNAFKATAKAWQSKFGVPYSTCGCPLPFTPPVVKAFKSLRPFSSPSSTSTFSTPGALAAASHPSDHNALVVLSPSLQAQRKEREKEAEKRARRAQKERSLSRSAREEKRGEGGEGKWAHQAAFFLPIPLIAAGAVGVALTAGAMAGCVPTEPNVVDRAGGATCGTSGGACTARNSEQSSGAGGGGGGCGGQ